MTEKGALRYGTSRVAPIQACSHSERTLSKSIPIVNHIKRTESEKNLLEDEMFAEQRDHCMYNRIVNGIRRQQLNVLNSHGGSPEYLYKTDACIENIHRSRFQHPDNVESLHSRGRKAWKSRLESPCSSKEGMERPLAYSVLANVNNRFLSSTCPRLGDEEEIFVLEL